MSFSQNLITNIFTNKLSSVLTKPEEYNGDLIPVISDVFNIGTSSKRWNDLYVDNIIGNVSILNIPQITTSNIIYYNSSSGSLSFGPVSGGGGNIILDPFITGNIRCNHLQVNHISGNLVSNVSILGNVFMPNIRNITSGNVVYYNNVSRELTFGLSTAPLESGLSYVNTTTSTILAITTSPVIVPIQYAVAPTITHTMNWISSDWAIGTGTTNRFTYTGTSKRFYMEIDMCLGTGISASTTYIALYKNGSALANSGLGQTMGNFGGINPSLEMLSWLTPFTAVSGDFFELFIYGLSTGKNIQPVSATLFSPSTLIPSISIEIMEVRI
jgi:hypothetical protein